MNVVWPVPKLGLNPVLAERYVIRVCQVSLSVLFNCNPLFQLSPKALPRT